MNNFEGVPDFGNGPQVETEEAPKTENAQETGQEKGRDSRKENEENDEEKLLTAEELEKMNYYERLDVSENAPAEEIKKAYRKLSFKYHPDKTGGERLRMQLINEAHEVLEDKEKRAEYDKYLGGEWKRGRSGAGFKYSERPGEEGIVPADWEGFERNDTSKNKKNAKNQTANHSYSSSGSGGSPKQAEPEKPKETTDKKKPGFLARFFGGFWKGIQEIFSGFHI